MRKNIAALKAPMKKFLKENKVLYNIVMILRRKRPVLAGITRNIRGDKNEFRAATTAIFSNCTIDIIGEHNKIDIADFCEFRNVTFLIRGNNNAITIRRGVKFGYGGSLHIEDDLCLIEIGANTTFEDAHVAVTEPGSRISIGEDCMFAYDIDLRTGDSHSIIDTRTNRRINPPGDIRIGDHVWVTPHCSILKGVEIKKDSVVATRSVVTKSFDQPGIIIGGSPSKILKENITWDRRRIVVEETPFATAEV